MLSLLIAATLAADVRPVAVMSTSKRPGADAFTQRISERVQAALQREAVPGLLSLDAGTAALKAAGITDPRTELAMAEVHDCFTPTELVLMEDLGFCERGTAWKEIQAGTFDLTGDLPVNPDGGLKSFGHPVGASGLRMMFEAWLQLRGEAPADRQIATTADRHLALTHNLGGYPGEMVSFVSILGT